MALTTSQLRAAYSPACADGGNTFTPAYKALDACFRKWRYYVRPGTGAYNCRAITGGTGYSLHSYPDNTKFTFWNGLYLYKIALAVDINPSKNPYGPRLITDMPRGMIDDIMRIRTNSGLQVWRWGGYFSTNKDAMHFEIVVSRSHLATGINPKTVPGYFVPTPPKVSTPIILPPKDDSMLLITFPSGNPAAFFLVGGKLLRVEDQGTKISLANDASVAHIPNCSAAQWNTFKKAFPIVDA
jgi:hypothetical protein